VAAKRDLKLRQKQTEAEKKIRRMVHLMMHASRAGLRGATGAIAPGPPLQGGPP